MIKGGGEVSGKGCNSCANGLGKGQADASLVPRIASETDAFELKGFSLSIRDEKESGTVNSCPLADRQGDISQGFGLNGSAARFRDSLLWQGDFQMPGDKTAQA